MSTESNSGTSAVRLDASRLPEPPAKIVETQKGEILALWCFWGIVVYTFIRNILAAAAKPLWYDELYTVTIARQPSWKASWHALGAIKDGNPPGFYFLERLFGFLPLNEQIAYHLVSIAGFCFILVCIFLFIRKSQGSVRALICTSIFLLTPLLRPYAVEARAYCLVAASLAFALICYQRAPRTMWMLAMGAVFAAAESMHYLAFFGFAPFAVAEFSESFRAHKIRWSVWLALSAGFLPIMAFWRLSSEIRRYYGSHIWSPASLLATANMYSLLFKASAPVALAVVFALVIVASQRLLSLRNEKVQPDFSTDVSEAWIAITFLCVPIIAFVFSKLLHGVYTERYVLATVLGIPLSVAFVLRLIPRKGVMLAGVLVLAAVGLQEGFFWRTAIRDVRAFVPPNRPVERMLNRVGYLDLRVVISDGEDYFQIAHYSPQPKRFISLIDPPEAVIYAGSDIVDLQLAALRCCVPLRIYTLREFRAQYQRFLLYSGGGAFDWWPARLVNDGASLQLLAEDQNRRVYLVNLKARSDP